MEFNPPFYSLRRLQWGWKIYKALDADRTGDWQAGLRYIEEAQALGPLPTPARVISATLLLRGGRAAEAQAALNRLVADLEGSGAPSRLYLKAYCESLLEAIWRRACMAELEKVAPHIPGVAPYWKGRFPIPDCSFCETIKSL